MIIYSAGRCCVSSSQKACLECMFINASLCRKFIRVPNNPSKKCRTFRQSLGFYRCMFSALWISNFSFMSSDRQVFASGFPVGVYQTLWPFYGAVSKHVCCRAEASPCMLSEWISWSPCSATCGMGMRSRERYVKVFPEDGSSCREPTEETEKCVVNEDCCEWGFFFLLSLHFTLNF